MNQNPQNRRGRPKGTGIDDAPLLQAIAEELDRTPSRSSHGAIIIVLAKAYPDEVDLAPLNVKRESVVRRLREKWKQQGPELLLAVRQRREKERADQMAESLAQFLAGLTAVHKAISLVAQRLAIALDAFSRSPEGKRMLQSLAAIQAIKLDPKLVMVLGGVARLASVHGCASSRTSADRFLLVSKSVQ